ncbi:MAG: hypothetical protein JSS96_00015 [Bacteroidetes bacterium]|nr:hypothetical protein [Bacteroidota bacterium]
MLTNLNKVFLTIKKHCQDIEALEEQDCIDFVAKEAGLSKSLITVYLDILQHMKLIQYAATGKEYILLTPLGKKTNKIPSTLN